MALYHRAMVSSSHRLQHELSRWKGARVTPQATTVVASCDALEQTCGYGLPTSYRDIICDINGAVFANLQLYSAEEARAQWHVLQDTLTPIYEGDPDWPDGRCPPHCLLPIGVGMDDQMRVLDTSVSDGEILLWQRNEEEFVTVHSTVESWLMTEIHQLSVHYDPSGRPKPLRGGDTIEKPRQVIEAHLDHEPFNAYANLLLAHWHASHSPPEEALFAYRRAAACQPVWGVALYYYARWAIVLGRHDEARSVLRRCVATSVGDNPRKNSCRFGYRPAAQHLLADLYDQAGQHRKALEQRRACQESVQRYGHCGYEEAEDFQSLQAAIQA